MSRAVTADTFSFTARFGAQVLAENRTLFSLWAPSAAKVYLEIEGRSPQPMTGSDEGVFQLETNCGHDTLYHYRVCSTPEDPGTQVPDPASRAQEGDIVGPSRVVDPARYRWKNPAWQGRPWAETVIYELHVGVLGGFEGVRQHLRYLADLGVTAIELMPVAEFPGGRNWGYDGVLPYSVEASYGGPEQMKALIDEAHGLGLMVFLDVVYNHFGPDGNYLATYARDFFREDLVTPWGASIDFRQNQVRRYFIANALMWLIEYRVDGLRFDAVHAISERDFLVEMAQEIRRQVPRERHVHLVLENEGNNASLLDSEHFTAQWNDDGHNVLHVLMTGESEGYYSDFVEDATNKLVRCLGEGFIFQGQNTRGGHPRGEPSGHLAPHAFVLFLQNHDQIGNRALGERLGELADPDALAAATVLLLLSPMVPLFFMGDEWGSRRPFLFFTEHRDELAEAVREGRRAEFADFAAFQDEAQRRLIPDPNAEETFESSVPDFEAREEPSHRVWLDRYRELLELRYREIVPRLDGAKALGAKALGEGAVVARWRMGDGVELLIAVNLGDSEVALAAEYRGERGQCLYGSRSDAAARAESGLLPGGTALVWLGNQTTKSDANG